MSTEIARVEGASLALTFTNEQKKLIADTICEGATPNELALFLYQCQKTGLDPLARQAFAVKRWDSATKREKMAIQTSIDGQRLIAHRTGKYAGQKGPFWCGQDGEWHDVWLDDAFPVAAKVGVLRSDFKEPCWGVARWNTFAQKKKSGEVMMMWRDKPDIMLAKCAESQALRKAFPQELSGIYSKEEMAHADNEPVEAQVASQATSPEKFDMGNESQCSHLNDFLKSANVPRKHWQNIAMLMNGKLYDKDNVLAAVKISLTPPQERSANENQPQQN